MCDPSERDNLTGLVTYSINMLLFCPTCGNLLLVEESANCLRFSCGTCPYISNITGVVKSRNYPKLKVNTLTRKMQKPSVTSDYSLF